MTMRTAAGIELETAWRLAHEAEAKAIAAEAAARKARRNAQAIAAFDTVGTLARKVAEIADRLELEACEARGLAEAELADAEDATDEALSEAAA